MVELPHEDCYSRCCLCYGLEDTKEDDERQMLPKGMFHEESDEVEKYVVGLPDMIRGNVMSYQPKIMEKIIEFANDQMDQKVLTIAERQAEQKRKLEFNAGNNQGRQQQIRDKTLGGLTLLGMVNIKSMLELFHYAISANFTTMARATSDCPELKNQNHGKKDEDTKTHGVVYALGGEETDQDPNNIEDEIEAQEEDLLASTSEP
nr:hypothetical protein [Tanacetum cinerariifolium]